MKQKNSKGILSQCLSRFAMEHTYHFRVPLIIKEFQDIGYQTWFDGSRMKGDRFQQMAQGIQNTQSVIVFITQKYIDKVKGENVGDECKRKLNYTAARKTSSNMARVLM